MADGSTAGDTTQRFCDGVLRRLETAGRQAGRGVSAVGSLLRCFAAIDGDGVGFLLVNPGVDIGRGLGKIGQISVFKRRGIAPVAVLPAKDPG